jgi:hypothetical protein
VLGTRVRDSQGDPLGANGRPVPATPGGPGLLGWRLPLPYSDGGSYTTRTTAAGAEFPRLRRLDRYAHAPDSPGQPRPRPIQAIFAGPVPYPVQVLTPARRTSARTSRRATVATMPRVPADSATVLTEEALLALLLPFWHLVIGGFVLVAIVSSAHRLARRGRSRMTTGLLVTAAAIIALAMLGLLMSSG